MNKSKILIIEDNADIRNFLAGFLDKEYETLCAENGVVGLELARTKMPDLILLDIMLPILSGYDVCNLLKKDERTVAFQLLFYPQKIRFRISRRVLPKGRMTICQNLLITRSSLQGSRLA